MSQKWRIPCASLLTYVCDTLRCDARESAISGSSQRDFEQVLKPMKKRGAIKFNVEKKSTWSFFLFKNFSAASIFIKHHNILYYL